MTAPALNLLRWPGRGPAWPSGLWRLWRPMALAVLMGALLGAGAVAWQVWRLAQWQAQRSQWLAQSEALEGQRKAEAVWRAQQQVQQGMSARAQVWQARHDQLQRLHLALQQQADVLGLRVSRWQADGRQLSLHGWLPQAQDVPALVQALTGAGLQGWSVQALSDHTASGSAVRSGGVDVLLQAPWPAPAPAKTGRTP